MLPGDGSVLPGRRRGVTLPSVRPFTRWSAAEVSVLLIVAASAWVLTVDLATGMEVMPGTMGLAFGAFLGVWTLMMAAMMLPSIAPLASLYARTMRDHRGRRLMVLAGGYLVVWGAAGVLVFVVAHGAERVADDAPGWAQLAAVGSCLACGLYQMTAWKDRCLQNCRSPLGHLLRFTALRGPFVDARVGLHHGAWCLACCWSLMLLLVTFGVMNVVAMVVLAVVILVEKLLTPGRWFSIAVGVGAIGLAVAIWIDPSLAPGLHATSTVEMGGM
jgi:predicted metal-binding membrane protein